MTNKYLEKVALNAFKARSMAKAVGVIPESGTSWKYALRNLRDGKGAPLQGKALSDARTRLGDVTNNTYQRMKSLHQHHGGTQGYEFATRVDHSGRIQDSVIRGNTKGMAQPRGNTVGLSDNLHTHPRAGIHYENSKELRQFPARLAEPSGKTRMEDISKKLGKGTISDVINSFREARTDYSQSVKLHNKFVRNGDYLKATDIANKIKPAGDHMDHVDGLIKSPRSFATDDARGLVRKNMYKEDRHMERIVAPDHNVVSSNKSRGDGIRSVYFDHTPRKAK
jgi:hypothetical protein